MKVCSSLAVVQAYACVVGIDCDITVIGFMLSVLDRAKLARLPSSVEFSESTKPREDSHDNIRGESRLSMQWQSISRGASTGARDSGTRPCRCFKVIDHIQEVLINSGQSLQTNSIAPEPDQSSSQNRPGKH